VLGSSLNCLAVSRRQYFYSDCRVQIRRVVATSTVRLDKISSVHSLAHSATKIIFNFFQTYQLRHVIELIVTLLRY